MREPEGLVVRAPNWIGDAVLALPALRDLRRSFPAARLEVLARPWVAEVYAAVEEADGVRPTSTLGDEVAWMRGRFDLAVVLPNSFGTALRPFLARVPERWGYATDGRGRLLTRRCRVGPEVRGRSEVHYYRAMLAGVGLQVEGEPDASLRCPTEWRERGGERLGESASGWIGLAPGAAFGTAKRWPPERFAAAGDRLARESGSRPVLLGGEADRPLCEAVAAAMSSAPRVLAGETSLPELLGVLTRLRLLLTNDSGPMHLAAALGTPVVAVFGSTDWRETAPWGEGHRLVREDVACAPCKLRECPLDHRCMNRVTVDRVVEAALEVLEGGAGGAAGAAGEGA